MELQQTESGLLIPKEKPPEPEKFPEWDQQEYYRLHARCPQCGSGSHEVTTMGFIKCPDRNRSTCSDCGWRGIVDERVAADAWHELAVSRPYAERLICHIRTQDDSTMIAYWMRPEFWMIEEFGPNDVAHENVTHWAEAIPKAFP